MRTIACLLLILLATLAAPAAAQNAIHRCVDARGNPVFTDQPCSALQASPVQAAPPAANVAAANAPVPLQTCAATDAELRQRVIDAFAARDPNRLAGLMLWRGYGHGAAVGDIRALGRLVRQPLLEIHLGGDSDDDPAAAASAGPPPAAASAPPPADELRLRTSAADGERSARFAIARQAGCLWLRYGG